MSYFETSIREYVKSVIEAIKYFFPIEGKVNRLEIKNVEAKFDKDLYDYNLQREYRWKDKTWDIPIYATVVLKSKDGKVLDQKRVLIARVPILTPRFTFLVSGTEYHVPTQMRLLPGVYHEKKADNTIQANFNQINLKGRGIKLILNPKDFTILLEYGTVHVPLIPLLLSLGVKEERLRNIVGDKIYALNYKKTLNYNKLFRALGYENAPPNPAQTFKKLLESTTLTPEVTKVTLGKEYKKVDVDTLVRSLERVIEVLRGGKEDDRDSLLFKQVVTPSKILGERLRKMVVLKNRLKNTVDKRKKVADLGLSSFFTPAIRSFFTNSQISNVESFTGPISAMSAIGKITIMGEAGIGDIHRVTDKQRMINPSTFLFLDPVHTPDNIKIGTTLHLTSAIVGEKDGKLAVGLKDRKGKRVILTPEQVYNSVIGIKPYKDNRWMVLHKGKFAVVNKNKIDYFALHPLDFFSHLTTLVPFLNHDSGNRVLMAVKQLEQALPLKEREYPLVFPVINGRPVSEDLLDSMGIFFNKSPVSGTISKITSEYIYIKDKSGKTHKISMPKNYPLQDGFLDSEPLVKEGQKVKEGELLFDTNYTKEGRFAFGKNLLVAYMPFKGYNIDDAIVISESAAKKLSSEHLYEFSQYIDKDTSLSKKKYVSLFPSTPFTREQLTKLDDDGVIKTGQVIEEGDPIILVIHKELPTPEQFLLAKFSKKLAIPERDRSVVWERSTPGKVIKVVKSPKFVKVYIRTEEPARVGDKLANRHGNKGVIGAILPDSEMPKTKDGKVIDVALNPLGVISRMNMGQVLETLAGKIAEKTGKPYPVESFKEDYYTKIKEELKKLKIPDKEDLIDPKTGKAIPDVFIGPQYIMKLKHRAEPKLHARGAGAGEKYSYDALPLGSSEGGAQSLGHLGLYAMLAHGAKANLYEAQTYKSDYNPDFWYAFQSGLPIPRPKTPLTYQKFESYLRALGINIEKLGNVLQFVPLFDEDILKLSNGKVDATRIIRMKKGDPIAEEGGLFDPRLTGDSLVPNILISFYMKHCLTLFLNEHCVFF